MTKVDFAAQAGGSDAGQATRKHFVALKKAAAKISMTGLPYAEISFLLRISGELTHFSPPGPAFLPANKRDVQKNSILSVDIVISESDYRGSENHLVGQICSYLLGAIHCFEEADFPKKNEIDWEEFSSGIGGLCELYRNEIGSLHA